MGACNKYVKYACVSEGPPTNSYFVGRRRNTCKHPGVPEKFLLLGEEEEHPGSWSGFRRLCEGTRVS